VGAAAKAAAEAEDLGGLRVLWLTRTAAEVSHAARELGSLGARPFYGRRVLCILDPVSRVDEKRFPTTCRAVRVGHKCPYWPGRPQKPVSLGLVTVTELKEAGRRFWTCPYEVQLKSIPSASFLVATHRQLPVVGWLLGRWRAKREEVLLVLDEAQNLLLGALEMLRDELSLTAILRASKEAEKYGFPELSRQLREAAKKYEEIAGAEVEVEDLLPSWEDLLLVGEEIQEKKLRAGYVPACWTLRLADFAASLGGEKPLLTREGKTVRLLALQDPVEHLRRVLEGWSKIVLMSATISGELIESLLGEETTLLRAGWPADDEEGPGMAYYHVSGLTTKFEARDEVMIDKTRRLLAEVAKRTRSHGWGVLVYFPSYELLEWTKETMEATTADDSMILWEARGASQEEVDSLVKEFTSRQGGRVLCAVAGGRLAEGVDLPADLVVVVGVPFSPPSPRQERLIKRLSEVLGDKEKAWRYAVALPAVWKVVQAAGRAVRGPEDSAIILLVDDRYQHLRPLLPR
jgi:Rad3-related DNA helicase